jgi:hypothetical protein
VAISGLGLRYFLNLCGNISLKNYQAVVVILFYLNKPVNTSIHPQCYLVVKRLIVVVDTVTNHNNSYHSSGTPQTPQYRHDKSISLWINK